jgi:hypothetical protein
MFSRDTLNPVEATTPTEPVGASVIQKTSESYARGDG